MQRNSHSSPPIVDTNVYCSALSRLRLRVTKVQGVSEKMDLFVFVPVVKRFTEPIISYGIIWE